MFGDINITFDDRKSPFIDSAFAKQFRVPNSDDISNLYYPVPWRQKDHIGTDNRCFAINKENGIFLFDCGSPESQRFLDYSTSYVRISRNEVFLVEKFKQMADNTPKWILFAFARFLKN
jgi:hypothetical protein